jgi:hypothetical protein
VSVLSVEIDMPDRVTSGDDIASGAENYGKIVMFDGGFAARPALGIAAQNLQQGDFYEIPVKTTEGFVIKFKDSLGNVVNRTFDYVARSYGNFLDTFSSIPTLSLNFAEDKTLDPRITFARASTARFYDANGILQSAANNVARFDHNPVTGESLGLLIEEQRTNSIRNSTGVGAVAGTPGTLPTNWRFTGGGLAANVIGTGVEGGINYIDVQFVGTTTASSSGFRFEGNSGVTAASGQTWTSSFYIRQVGGSTSGFSTIGSSLSGIVSSGSPNAATVPLINDLGASSLSAFRPSVTVALANVNTTAIRPQLLLTYSIGAAIDITLRIGLPQLEQGAFATSPILTTTAAATRAADAASMTGANFSSWYAGGAGTLFVDTLFSPIVDNVTRFTSELSVGTTSEVFATATFSASTRFRAGGVSSGGIGTLTANQPYKFAYSFENGGQSASLNGASVVTGVLTSTAQPDRLTIGATRNNAAHINTTIKKLAFYPLRLTDTQLQALTT